MCGSRISSWPSRLMAHHTFQGNSNALHTAHCTLHTAHYTLRNAHCTMHTAQCTQIWLKSAFLSTESQSSTLHLTCPCRLQRPVSEALRTGQHQAQAQARLNARDQAQDRAILAVAKGCGSSREAVRLPHGAHFRNCWHCVLIYCMP